MIHLSEDGQLTTEAHKTLRLCAESAALLFRDNGWTWYVEGESPDADRIANQLISLMSNAYQECRRLGSNYATISGGRLYARLYHRDEWQGYAVEFGITFTL